MSAPVALAAPSPEEENNPGSDGTEITQLTPEQQRKAELRAKRIANLKPWPKGVSGNPQGTHRAGLTITQWFNALTGKTEDKLRAIAKDRKQPTPKRIAARQWLQALTTRKNNVGQPINGEAIDRLFDRTVGKATQRTEVSGPDGGPIQQAQVVIDLASCLEIFESFIKVK